jgi:hypothetical protein
MKVEGSSQVKFLITNNAFALRKEQQHSQKQESFVVIVWLKLLRVFKPAGLTVFLFSQFFLFNSLAHLGFSSKFL